MNGIAEACLPLIGEGCPAAADARSRRNPQEGECSPLQDRAEQNRTDRERAARASTVLAQSVSGAFGRLVAAAALAATLAACVHAPLPIANPGDVICRDLITGCGVFVPGR